MVTVSRSALGSIFVAAVIVLALLHGGPASARQENRDQDRDKDGQSRHELEPLQRIPLVLRGGRREDIDRLILIQIRYVSIARSRFGVEVESLDKIDAGEVPLLGKLFGDALRSEDLNADNRVGAVYGTGNGGLAAFLDDDVAVEDGGISVVNGKNRYSFARAPDRGEVSAQQLGELGELASVQQAVTGRLPDGSMIVLRGLTRTSVPQVDDKVPVLADVPLLQNLFRGTVHRRDDELIVFIRPSIIAGDEE